MELIYLSLGVGILAGTINYIAMYKKGFTAISGWIIGIFAYTSIAYLFIKYFYQ